MGLRERGLKDESSQEFGAKRCFDKTNSNKFALEATRVHSSVVEHLTADQEVTGSNPVGPFSFFTYFYNFLFRTSSTR